MDDREIKAWQRLCQAEALIKKMEQRGFKAFYAPTAAEARAKVLSLLPPEGAIGLLGSQTMNQLGVYAELRAGQRELVDHATVVKDLSPQQAHEYRCRVFLAAAMLASANAVDTEGRLYNIDGLGNRVAAMIYGPERVILAIGLNKLASGPEEAWRRIREIAAPQNNKRLGNKTPCAQSGHCHDCQIPNRICNYFSVIERCRPEGRLQIVLVGEDLGY